MCAPTKYGFDQFFWSGTNKREDRYGGTTIKERARFAGEVVAAIRKAVGPDFPIILRVSQCTSIAHVIATIGLELSKHGTPPEIHFGWSSESPLAANLDFLLFGEGNVPWLVRELILKAEPHPERQPRVIIG